MLCANGTFVRVVIANIASAVFAICLVRADNSFGRTFTHVFGTPEVLVSYLKWLGGQPGRNFPFLLNRYPAFRRGGLCAIGCAL